MYTYMYISNPGLVIGVLLRPAVGKGCRDSEQCAFGGPLRGWCRAAAAGPTAPPTVRKSSRNHQKNQKITIKISILIVVNSKTMIVVVYNSNTYGNSNGCKALFSTCAISEAAGGH